MHIYLEKRKVSQVSVLILRKNGCSVRHMFCSIFVPFSVAKVLEKHVESSSYLLLVFFKENFHMGNLLNGCFCYSYTNFFKPIFFRAPISTWGSRLWVLKINNCKLCLYGIFYIRQTCNSQSFTAFYRLAYVLS